MNRIEVVKGNLLNIDADAIVNPSNNSLTSGRGVNKDIFYNAGPRLSKACKNIGHCETGHAVVTCGYNLEIEYIIHAVGPYWYGGYNGEAEMLSSCYKAALTAAVENNFSSIAFPSISTGHGKYPIEEAAQIAIYTIEEFLKSNNSDLIVYIVCNDHDTWIAYRQASKSQDINIDKYLNREKIYIKEKINDKERTILKKKIFKKEIEHQQIYDASKSILKRVIDDKYKDVILLDSRYTKSMITENVTKKYNLAGLYITYDMITDILFDNDEISFSITPFFDVKFYDEQSTDLD